MSRSLPDQPLCDSVSRTVRFSPTRFAATDTCTKRQERLHQFWLITLRKVVKSIPFAGLIFVLFSLHRTVIVILIFCQNWYVVPMRSTGVLPLNVISRWGPKRPVKLTRFHLFQENMTGMIIISSKREKLVRRT